VGNGAVVRDIVLSPSLVRLLVFSKRKKDKPATTLNLTAKQYGITKQAISKKLISLAEEFDVRLDFQRCDRVREIYAQRARRIHKKRKRETPKFNIKSLLDGLCQ
jgi:hypothetical protein